MIAYGDAAVLIGVMSGTSLDGITAAAARIQGRPRGGVQASLLGLAHRPYAPDERRRLEAAMQGGTARDYCRLHADLGEWCADAAQAAMATAGLTPRDVTAIASHGHTVWHEVGHSTWQAGDAARLAERTGCAVIADFRTRDMAAGGQGAPLVPMADALLFAHDTAWRALQNLGGIGNVTIVPPAHDMAAGTLDAVRAFDTGPGVVLIDGVTRALRPDLPFDRDGACAAAGSVLTPVLEACLADPYFKMAPPKSTGRELFTPAYLETFLARCAAISPRADDAIATATAFTAHSLADQYERFIAEPITEVLLAGGGARNPTLVAMIRDALQGTRHGRTAQLVDFDAQYFDGDAKEAVAFALLGYLHLAGRPGNIPTATGAQHARVLGHLTPAA